MRAGDPPIRQGEVLKQVTAGRASFGSIGGVDQHEVSSSVCSFGDKTVAQVGPALIQNAFAEVVVANHVGDTQVFQSDEIIALCVGVGDLVEQVLALVGDMFV